MNNMHRVFFILLPSFLYSMTPDTLDLSRVLLEIRKVQKSTGAFKESSTQVEKEFSDTETQTDVRFFNKNKDALDQVLFDQETKLQEILRRLDILENKYFLEKEKSEKNNPLQQERIFNFLVEKYSYEILGFRHKVAYDCFVYEWSHSQEDTSENSIYKGKKFLTKPQIEYLFGKNFNKEWLFPVRKELADLKKYPHSNMKGREYEKTDSSMSGFYFGFSEKGSVGLKIMDWIDKASLSMSPSQAEYFIDQNLEKQRLSIYEMADKNLKDFGLYDTCVIKKQLDIKSNGLLFEFHAIRQAGDLKKADDFFRTKVLDFASFKKEYLEANKN